MNKYTYSILGLCIISLITLGLTFGRDSEEVTPAENQPVDLSIDYTNGTHYGYINTYKSESGRVYLSIDFVQAFASKKSAFLASIAEEMCPLSSIQQYITTSYPNELTTNKFADVLSLQNPTEAAVYFGKMTEDEIKNFAQYTGCFPYGINYTRNRSTVERERSLSTYFSSIIDGETITQKNIMSFLDKKTEENPVKILYKITLKDSIVTKIGIDPQ